ncbi:hypothetical protein HA402_007531 [Bradysia odoriphaga]|nr:hypothetical protein HA402_007531 [Bradysia odoriphaga]
MDNLDTESQIEIISIENIASDEEIVETYIVQEDGSFLEICDATKPEPKKLTRKRKRNCDKWKRNVAKMNRQSGQLYKNCRGAIQPGRHVKTKGCSNPSLCPYKCSTKITSAGRQSIFDSFWALSDDNKRHFYVANVKRRRCIRQRTEAVSSQKSFNFYYYFNYMDEDVQVCQQFFNNTLNISPGRVYYYFGQNKNKVTITPGVSRHGKHPKKVLSIEQKQGIRDHINRFPVVESHYCRQNTNKNYLNQGLNLSIMYRLYTEDTANPAKLSAYRNIFNYEFNLAFFRPKKDRCDKCMAFEILTSPSREEEDGCYRDILPAVHRQRRSAVVAADMENVFQLPITNASIAYYMRKFAVLSFTAVVNKTVYNAIWNEALCGREGTHIANAMVKLLTRITEDNPDLEHITVWSDSCVPQNRNSIMSAAIQRFIDSSISCIQQIDQKFSEPGHSKIQEVDTAHSVIEKSLRHKFIYSPTVLIDEIRNIPEGKLKFVTVEMEAADYLDYHHLAQGYNYTVIPYTKVKQLRYKKNESKIWIKYDFPADFEEKPINVKPSKISGIQGSLNLELTSKLSTQKIADIRNMFGIMPESDRLFYENVFLSVTNKNFEHENNENETGAVVQKTVKSKPIEPAFRDTMKKSNGRTSHIVNQSDELYSFANCHDVFEPIQRISSTPDGPDSLKPRQKNICYQQATSHKTRNLKGQQNKTQSALRLNESEVDGEIVEARRTSTRIKKLPTSLKCFDL